jgi:aspartate aminotransferase
MSGVTGASRLSRRARELEPSATVALDTRAKELLAAGVDVVNLSVGEPDQETPAAAREGAVAAIAGGLTKYTATAGTPALRRAICDMLRRDCDVRYEPEEIVVSNGAKQSLYNATMVLVDPGDEVVIPSPHWVSYPEMVRMAGGTPVLVRCGPEDGYKLTVDALRAAIGPRTRGLVLNNPANPTGAVYGRDELEAIVGAALEHGLVIFSDEIYRKLVYGVAAPVSVASLSAEARRATITVNGFSKAYAMTGWRLGYAAAEPAIARAMADLQSQVTSGPSSISQEAGRAALEADQAPVERMRQEFDERRRYVLGRLDAMPGVRVRAVPEGAFYVFPDVTGCVGRSVGGVEVGDSAQLATTLLETARVAVVPGEAFGASGHVRISYATSMDRLEEGMNRLERLLRAAT